MRVAPVILSLVSLALSIAPSTLAQNTDPNNNTGIHAYETYDGARESINLGSGNVFVSVPLLTLRGRNGHNYSVALMSNSQSWSPSAGWNNKSLGMVLTRTAGTISLHPTGIVNPVSGVQCNTGYTMTDESGGVHTFSNVQSNCIWVGGGPNQGQRMPEYDILGGSDDRGEGIHVDISGCTLTLKNGDWVPLLSGSGGCPLIGVIGNGTYPPTLKDSNGNAISSFGSPVCTAQLCGGGNLFPSGTDTDTLGRGITYSSNTIQYKDSNGVQRTITLNMQSLTLSCTFAVPGGGLSQPSGTANVITSAVLPNGLTYIFQYDGCGNLSKIVYPSGGYTRYVFDYSHYTHAVYANGSGQATTATDIELVQRYICRAASGTTGTTSTGTGNTCSVGEDMTAYSPTTGGCYNSAMSVADPLGNTTAYQFSTNTGYQCSYPVVETSRQIYQGTSTLLRTIQTQYTGMAADFPAIQTTILPNGLQSQTQWDYWCNCSDDVKEKREYGWDQGAAGALARKTDYGQNYCDAKAPSETVYDGSGNQIAMTTYEFDNYTAGIGSSGAVQHDSNYGTGFTARCNVTAIQRWRNTDGATLTTRMQYDDAGNVLSTTDPLNHTTTTSYADVWGNNTCAPAGGNAAAYPTQVTDPAGLITKHTYNSCIGTAATNTDPNNQVASLSYDLMDRVSQITFPDTGQVSTCFSEVSGGSCHSSSYPLSVVATQKVSSSLNKISTALLDGLARVSEAQLNSDPDCTAPNGVKIDTTYDGVERKSSVSNPYCTTSDAIYGVTTYNYDALNRVTKVIPPDGTSSGTNNVSTVYDIANGTTNCTLATDQTGKARRTCADGLGRLAEADEAPTNGPGTPGTGSVTISGSDRSYTFDPCAPQHSCPQTIWDGGTITVTVNGVQAGSTSYGQSTLSSLATALASSINGNSSSPVTAVANGATVNLTSKAVGSATNYSLSASSATANTQYFSGTSFPISTSGANLTGGSDVTFTYALTTLYTYDVLNNLLTVNQKGGSTDSTQWRTRTFAYNSLSQLLCAANPELALVTCPNPDNGTYITGTVRYSYDNDGNLITKTAPKPNQTSPSVTVQTSYTYENDNRVTQKSYNDGVTPTVRFAYDGNALTGCTTAPPLLGDGYPKGRRTAMCDGAGAESWSHDTMGRVLTDSRTTNGVTKSAVYAYSPYLDGSINAITYPSGRVMTFTLASSGANTAERLGSVQDNSTSVYYATAAHYAPTGALSSLTNNTSLVSTLFYNPRLQPCRISVKSSGSAPAACTTTGAGNVLDFTYNFNFGSADNGNVAGITNNRDNTRSQNFTYDALNRLATAQTQTSGVTIPNSNCWGLTFGYDPWGNLLTSTISGPSGCSEPLALNVYATKGNQLSTSSTQAAGYCYDSAGNLVLTQSGACPTGSFTPTYSFNAENQLTSTASLTYIYDGDGKRVMKSNGTLYWYGMSSDPLDETDSAGNSNNSSFKEYVFFNGKRIARRDYQNNVNYYFADHLGTTRVSTNSSGSICYDADFYPFGGERIVTDTCDSAYKFTGKERDSESGLDNFGARYDSSSLGRFMSPDSTAYVKPINPQSWNLYAYARNNPLLYVDPTGNTVSLANCQDKNKCVQVLTNAAQLPKGVTAEVDKKGNLVLKGDLSKIKGGNALRLMQLVNSDKTANFWIGDSAPKLGGGTQSVGGGTSGLTSQGFNQNFSVVQADPSKVDSGDLRGVFLNPDGSATPGDIPGSDIEETAAHELLGHVWADLVGGQAAGTEGNKREALIAEDRVRNTDPAQGLKIRHQGQQNSVQLIRVSDLPRITNPGSEP